MKHRVRQLGMAMLSVGTLLLATGCMQQLLFGNCDDSTTVRVTLINDSTSQHVAPSLGICPNGMAASPHLFVDPTPVLAPGEQATYTSCQIASFWGSCAAFSADFAVGLCGWRYGPTEDELTTATERFGGQIGVQFNCGDTIILRWTDDGEAGGTWTSEVQPAAGNEVPAAGFQEIS